MTALILPLVVLCLLAPMRWVVAGLPAIWILQRLLPPTSGIPMDVGGVELSPTDVVIVVLAMRAAVELVWRKEVVIDRRLYLALGGYLLVNLLASMAAGIKFGEGHLMGCVISWVRFLSELLVLPIAAQAVRDMAGLKMCIRVLLGTLAAVALVQFVNYAGASRGIIIGEVQGIERGELRYFGPVGDAVGVVLLLGYIAALCYANVPGAALFFGGIALTGGLGAVLALTVGTGLFLVLGTRTAAVREFMRSRWWMLPLAVVGALLVAGFFAKPLTQTLLGRVTTGSYKESGSQRSVSARMALAMVTDNPLLGVGYMGYERALPEYGGERYFDLEHPDGATANANNQILQTLADGGVLGLGAFVVLMAAAGRLLWRASRIGDGFVATFFLAVFIWLLAQLFGNVAAVWLNPSAFVARILWVALGLAVAANRVMEAQADGSAGEEKGVERYGQYGKANEYDAAPALIQMRRDEPTLALV
jgi:hypothetical protein